MSWVFATVLMAPGADPRPRVEEARPVPEQLAVAVLLIGRQPTGILPATGVIVDKERRWIVTTWHFVAGAKNIGALPPLYENGKVVRAPTPYLNRYFEGKAASPALIRSDPSCDLALLELPKLPEGSAAKIARSPCRAADNVSALGNPLARNAMFELTPGAYQRAQYANWSYASGQRVSTNLLEFNARQPLTTGFSGGPVFNSQNELCGITIAAATQDGPVAYAVSADAIRRFVSGSYAHEALRLAVAGDLAGAQQLAERAVSESPTDPWNYLARSAALLCQNRPREAREDAERAVGASAIGSVFGRSRNAIESIVLASGAGTEQRRRPELGP